MQKPLPTAAAPTQGQAQTLGTMPTQPLGGPTPTLAGGPPTQATLILPGAQGQGITTAAAPDPGAQLRGWYPRWWLLSALFCSVLTGLVGLLQPVLCPSNTNNLFCQATNWSDWRQIFVVGSVWLVFLIGWVVAHVFGVVKIEVDHQLRGPIAQAMRTISEFETLYPMLYVYALVAFVIIVLMWYFNRFQVMGFSVCSLVIFVGISCFMQQQSELETRRLWSLGTALFSFFCIGVMLLLNRIQPVLLIAELLVTLIGLVYYSRTRPNAQAQNTAQQALSPVQIAAQQNASQLTPGRVFLSLLHSFRI